MEISVTLNADIVTAYTDFDNAQDVSFINQVVSIIEDERRIGVSTKQKELIHNLAQFYYDRIKAIELTFNTSWEI